MADKYLLAGLVLIPALLIVAAGAQESGVLTRGQTFTVTVIGSPRTAYDIWPRGTHFMTGKPGDQPPVVVPGQADVVQDPPGGPYVIGSHPINGGGTILDDVPPDSSTTSATAYYAEVTTGVNGYGVVLFQTSPATATGQQFQITAENPADLSEEVSVILGAPTPAPTQPVPMPLPTTMAAPFIPVPTATVPETPSPTTASPTAAPLFTPQPTGTPAETTPLRGMPLPAGVGIAAAGIGLLLAAGRRRTG